MAAAATPPASGVPTIAISVAQDAARAAAARGRSASPGQYGSHGYCGKSPLQGGGRVGSQGRTGAWVDTGVPSPRTPRQGQVGADFRLNVVFAEMQRQAEAERRQVRRQLEHLERRVCEQLAGPAAGRERWAELQGSVSGLLEEITALSRRTDGLEEKLLLRTGSCEELVRQRTRELEQHLQAQQQKALLAVSTSEEMSKRHTARLRKLGQAVEDTARRLASLEEGSRRPVHVANGDAMRLEARLSELEGQQVSLEDEFRSIMMSAAGPHGAALAPAAMLAGGASRDPDCSGGGGEFESVIRALERDLAALGQRTSAQLDEHATSLANLRIRTEGHEQRLSATAERLETVVAPPLEALRAEMAQLREHDRQEVKSQIEHMARQIQSVADAGEEASSELRDRLHDINTSPCSQEPQAPDAAIQRLSTASASQERALRRIEEAIMSEPQHHEGGLASNDLCSIIERMETLEHRVDCVEHGAASEELAEKADRAELVRLDAALQELSEPLHHLSQRTARAEAKSATLERRLEHLQHLQGAPPGAHAADQAERPGDGPAPRASGDGAALGALRGRMEELAGQLAELRGGDNVHGEHARRLAERIDGLQKDVKDIKADGREQQLARSQEERRLSGVDAAINRIQTDVKELQRSRHEIVDKAEDRSNGEGLSDVLRRVAHGEEATKALQRSLQRLESDQKELTDLKHAGAECSRQLSELQRQVCKGEEATRSLETRLDDTISDVLQPKLAALRKDLEQPIRRVQSQLDQLHAEHESLQRDSSHDKGTAETAQRLGKIEEGLEKFGQKLDRLRQDHDTSHDHVQRIGETEERVEALADQLDRLREDHQNSGSQGVSGDLADVIRRIGDTEDSVKVLGRQVGQLRQDQDESHDHDIEDRLREALRRIEETGKEVEGCRSEVEQLKKSRENGLSDRLSEAIRRIADGERSVCALQTELDQFRQDTHSSLEATKQREPDDLVERISEAMRRAASGEAAIETMRTSLSATESSVRDLSVQLKKSLARGEASDAAAETMRKELLGLRDSLQPCAEPREMPRAVPADIEMQIRELQRQVAEELDCLSRQQSEMLKAESRPAKVEARIREMQQQMEEELDCLARQQSALLKAESRPAKVEARVLDLQRQVEEELDCLMRHQETLRARSSASRR